jgi:hypothetical protein
MHRALSYDELQDWLNTRAPAVVYRLDCSFIPYYSSSLAVSPSLSRL